MTYIRASLLKDTQGFRRGAPVTVLGAKSYGVLLVQFPNKTQGRVSKHHVYSGIRIYNDLMNCRDLSQPELSVPEPSVPDVTDSLPHKPIKHYQYVYPSIGDAESIVAAYNDGQRIERKHTLHGRETWLLIHKPELLTLGSLLKDTFRFTTKNVPGTIEFDGFTYKLVE